MSGSNRIEHKAYQLLDDDEGFTFWLDRRFKVSARGSTIMGEVRAGFIGWLTMSYIMVVNPSILSTAAGPAGLDLPSLMTATALASALASLCVGLVSNLPFGMMPGMGLNAYFTYGICNAFGISWPKALSCCFVSGAVLVLLAVFGICDRIIRSLLSEHLKKAITASIGMLQALIGFQAIGLVVGSPDTLVAMGDLGSADLRLVLALGGLGLITALVVARVRGALLAGMMLIATVSWASGLNPPPSKVFAMPSTDALMYIDFSGWVPGSPELPALTLGALVMLLVCLFDVAGVQHGLHSAAGLAADDRNERGVFTSVGFGTMVGALFGTSPVIVANESGATIMEGARTGLSSLVIAVLFLASAPFSPFLCAVPRSATAVPLIIIGALMMGPCQGIDWSNPAVGLPSFLTITVVPFTYSIHGGIAAGIIMDIHIWVITKLFISRSGMKPDTLMESRDSTFHELPGCLGRNEEGQIATLGDLKSLGLDVERGRLLLNDLEKLGLAGAFACLIQTKKNQDMRHNEQSETKASTSAPLVDGLPTSALESDREASTPPDLVSGP